MSSQSTLTDPGTSAVSLSPTLKAQLEQALDLFFKTLDGHPAQNLFELVLREIEEPLIRKTLNHTRQNQVHAADILGLSRGTLRKKMEIYGIR